MGQKTPFTMEQVNLFFSKIKFYLILARRSAQTSNALHNNVRFFIRISTHLTIPSPHRSFCFAASFYNEMESVVGMEGPETEEKRRELMKRVRQFLKDTITEFSL